MELLGRRRERDVLDRLVQAVRGGESRALAVGGDPGIEKTGGGTSVPFRVLIDGQTSGPDHGIDVDEQGDGTITERRLYQLIRQRGDMEERTFEITFLDPGFEVHAFAFG